METITSQQLHEQTPIHQRLRTKLLIELTYSTQELLQDMLQHLDRPTHHIEQLSTLHRAMQLIDSGLATSSRVPLRFPRQEDSHAEK